MFFSRNELLVAFPIIRTKSIHTYRFKFFPQFFTGFGGAVAADKIEVFFSKSIKGLDYVELGAEKYKEQQKQRELWLLNKLAKKYDLKIA